jgi:hypothetical protein
MLICKELRIFILCLVLIKELLYLGLMIELFENHQNSHFSGFNLLTQLITFMIFGPSSKSEYLNNLVAIE